MEQILTQALGIASANWKDGLLIATSVVTIASIIAKYTKNTWDDKLVSNLLRILSLAPNPPTQIQKSQTGNIVDLKKK